jgi:hypothetical protein
MSCASLCLILIPQTPDLASDSRILVGNLAFWLSSDHCRFLEIYCVCGLKFLGIASHRDASHLPRILPQSMQPFGRSMDG